MSPDTHTLTSRPSTNGPHSSGPSTGGHEAPARAPKTCPVCWDTFTPALRKPSQTYCTERCRGTAYRRRRGEQTPAADTSTAPAAAALPQPAAHRDCPHCGGPITIVALLTTPEAARPSVPATASDGVIPLRR